MNFKPSGNNILVRPIEPVAEVSTEGMIDDVTESGIALAYTQGSEKRGDCQGEVIAVGDGFMGHYIPTWLAEKIGGYVSRCCGCVDTDDVREMAESRYPMQTKPGDVIVFDVGKATDAPTEERLFVISEDDVLGIVPPDTTVELASPKRRL
jgi:co-chaperonin GroES (HSP10)